MCTAEASVDTRKQESLSCQYSEALGGVQQIRSDSAKTRYHDSPEVVPSRRLKESSQDASQPAFGSKKPFRDQDGEDGSIRTERKNSGKKENNKTDSVSPCRLLLVSNKVKNSAIIQTALLSNVTFVQYKFEGSTLESILASISQSLGNKKVGSIALICHTSGSAIYLTGKDDKAITIETIFNHQALREFFTVLIRDHVDKTWPYRRLDILGCNIGQQDDVTMIAEEIKTLTAVSIGISKNITGSDIIINEKLAEDRLRPTCVGELYFRTERLRGLSGSNPQSLSGFEKIRTVGKGAYGLAVLYRKKDDDSLVILKEINLHDINASERQLALNEVRVLAMLDHPNIISYYDSFEEDGIVMIEMEYADGGTLSQYLAQQDKPLEERNILRMFTQMVAAIKHIHEHNILHRDLKTPNIFLTKEGVIKVGDFGISKMMTSANKDAMTVLGTPYYISPEMCEGKPYNDKSDIWALGCILYEMACLQKTFEGSNLPALVNKIMKGQFAPVKGNYSQEFKKLIMDMLQKEPEYRPSAADLWNTRLPEFFSTYEDSVTEYEDDVLIPTENSRRNKRKIRSVLYYFEMATNSLHAITLSPRSSRLKIRDVAVGADHVVVVSVERMVYTWGEGGHGQLGHGGTESKARPELVEALQGKSIIRACCGDGFSVFASDNGIVMTCGNGANGCLGHGDWCSTPRPRLIEALLSVDVISIACGPHHVAAIGSDGEVFTWGKGADGRLGLGTEDNHCQPMEVTLPESTVVRDCRCGRDGTMLVTEVGSVLACGDNEFNKLGLNQRQGFLMAMRSIFNKTEVPGEKLFTVVRALVRHRVLDVSMGSHHSAVIVEPGHVYTLGRNQEGQLGTGATKQQNAPYQVKFFEDKPALRVKCGDYYTVASTADNGLLFWGTRFTHPPKLDDSWNRGNRQDMRVESAGSTHSHTRLPSNASSNSKQDVTADQAGSSRCHSRQPSTSSVTGSRDNGQLSHSREPTTGSVTCRLDMVGNHASSIRSHSRQASTGSITGRPDLNGDHTPSVRSHSRQPSTGSGTVRQDPDMGLPVSVRSLSNFPSNASIGTRQDISVENAEIRRTHSTASVCNKQMESTGSSHSRHPSNASVSSATSSFKDNSNETNREGAKSQIAGEGENLTTRKAEQLSTDSVFGNSPDRDACAVPPSGGGFRPLSCTTRRTPSVSSAKDKDPDTILQLQPSILVKMDSSGAHSQAGDTVSLSNFHCHGENLFVQVETTAPPPKRKTKKRRYLRRRLMGENLEVGDGQVGLSASSRDGGDEYSSETSEMDSRGNIPTWIKQEFANSVRNPSEPDDTSDHSDEYEVPLIQSSMTDIKINKDLEPATVTSSIPKEEDIEYKEDVSKKRERKLAKEGCRSPLEATGNIKSPPLETGVEFAHAEPLSSSSSSDPSVIAKRNLKDSERSRPVGSMKRPSAVTVATSKRVIGPMPHKSKVGPQLSQKPLSRIRAQAKTRRSDPSKDSPTSKGACADSKLHEHGVDLMTLQADYEKLKEDKRKTEEKLDRIKKANKKHEEALQKEVEKKAFEKECELKKEVQYLRQELQEQNSKLQDNYKVMISLQEQLVQVQSEQKKMSASQQVTRPESRQSAQRESKICAIQ